MKTQAKIIAFIFAIALTKTISAQTSMDVFGIIPKSDFAKDRKGFGFNFFGTPLALENKKETKGFDIRFGGGFYFSGLEQKSVYNVPLSAPQVGNATVVLNSSTYGCNAITRFSFPYSKKIIPYIDVFAGLKGFSCDMQIDPYSPQTGYETQTSQNLSLINEFNCGVTGGVMASLGKSVKLNLGLSFSDSCHSYSMVDVSSACLESNNVSLQNTNAPHTMLLATVGLTFCFDPSKDAVAYYDINSGYNPYSGYSSGGHGSYGGSHSGGAHNSVGVSIGGHSSGGGHR